MKIVSLRSCCSRIAIAHRCLRPRQGCQLQRKRKLNPRRSRRRFPPSFRFRPTAVRRPLFDSARAMQYVKEIVAFGPRPIGSANHKKVEDYILAHLKGDEVENDVFTADTPEGKFPVHNIIAKFPGTKDGIIVIASHYDTNYPAPQHFLRRRQRWRLFQRAAA